MTTTVHQVLQQLRDGALDRRHQGDLFERLVVRFLQTDPEWVGRFDAVWRWSDWPDRGARTDTGIDVVARLRDGSGMAAIQCKFYGPRHKVSKGDIDAFLSASGGAGWVRRYVFDTANDWGATAMQTALDQAVPVFRVDLGQLDDSTVDWSQFAWSTPEVLVTHGPKRLRPHQDQALAAVEAGLAERDRGQLIMACGTGKTFTSLRIAERLAGPGGRVLFLVPSIQLLSQTLREWMAETEVGIRPFAVCSDVRVGRRTADDDGDISVIDLTEPATTDPGRLVERTDAERVGHVTDDPMTVVFCTYQSIDVIHQAQGLGMGEFDLVICDEAHRTTGVTLAGTDESQFVRVHDADYLRGAKRLYMTATPRLFGDDVKRKADEADAVLADMSDEATFGPVLHRLGFGDAVEADLLTDYRVLVLGVGESYVATHFQKVLSQEGEIALGDAAKLIGCWKGLAKHFGDGQGDGGPPMRRAVGFAGNIRASKAAAGAFPAVADAMITVEDVEADDDAHALRVSAEHVDGTMGIQERNRHLAWLKADPPEGECRILTNARCLSEGVDVPALDAVMFLSPRSSQVDVVQSVGRVMRKAPGKTIGYIILPVVVPDGVPADEALRDNARYKVVWQVLQALRSHDERFHAMVNQIELNRPAPGGPSSPFQNETHGPTTPPDVIVVGDPGQLSFSFPEFRDAVYARIVQKVGERTYWEDWARDIADIAHAHIVRIRGLITDPASEPARHFAAFLDGLRGNLNESITPDEAIEMLAQHLITRPVFEALFAGYDFVHQNPVAQTMEQMLAVLDDHNLESEQAHLDGFYASVRRRVEGVTNPAGKQRVIVELYDKFFATAFKRTVERLGIVYTPVEIVDFILRSADQVMRREFGRGLTDEGVHILDGFTGTGTFMVRLLQSGLIAPHDLARKYAHELHANEMLLLAYYIACVNIEITYASLTTSDDGEPGYTPFPGLVLTDTFQAYEDGDRDDLNIFPANNARIERQRDLPITVIVGNPPWSVGQGSANDDNQNQAYPTIDKAIRGTYAARSTARSTRTLYDSYVRAIKWASLRIGDRGVIAYVTNGGFLDANTADGMRQCLTEEFSAIHVLNLRGNARTAGELRRREGDPVFGGGSRATVVITVLVKDPAHTGTAHVHYTDIGDYLSQTEKLAAVAEAGGLDGLTATVLESNAHGDWLGQRSERFTQYVPLRSTTDEPGIFVLHSLGLASGRDPWVYGSSAERVEANISRMADNYNAAVDTRVSDPSFEPSRDPTRVSWNRNLETLYRQGRRLSVTTKSRIGQYRPFFRQHVYFERSFNAMIYQLPKAFPTPRHRNVGFVVMAPRVEALPAVMMVDSIPDLSFFTYTVQFFARYTWEPLEGEGQLDLAAVPSGPDAVVVDGYRRVDNVTPWALEQFRTSYGDQVTADDVFFYCYGLLHSPEYRTTYAADLKKGLPRIPLVVDPWPYIDAGRALADLHTGYEAVDPYPLDGLHPPDAPTGDAAYEHFAVGAKKMTFGKPTPEQKAAGARHDRTVITYNPHITLTGIPEGAYRYTLGSRSAIEWIIDRYFVRTDKDSGIVNDPNAWSREVGDPRYILDLMARIVTVSLRTMEIIDALPGLDIRGAQG